MLDSSLIQGITLSVYAGFFSNIRDYFVVVEPRIASFSKHKYSACAISVENIFRESFNSFSLCCLFLCLDTVFPIIMDSSTFLDDAWQVARIVVYIEGAAVDIRKLQCNNSAILYVEYGIGPTVVTDIDSDNYRFWTVRCLLSCHVSPRSTFMKFNVAWATATQASFSKYSIAARWKLWRWQTVMR